MRSTTSASDDHHQTPIRSLFSHTSGLQDYSELLILARGRAGVPDFTPEQIVELGWAIASYMAFGRLIHSFGLTPGEHL